jgi:sugar O-acyltransferase (sialic acid O-acetyltransferase NeuD family)
LSETFILLIGAGGHARACIDVVEQHGEFTIRGLIGTPEEVESVVLGYEVPGTDGSIPSFRHLAANALVTVGQIKTPDPRMRLFALLEEGGWLMPPIVSPRAYVSRHAEVGAGSIVMHGAVVNAAASIGRNCILNSNSLVEHDSTVADHCHISTSAAVNSGVCIGAGAFVGSGSSIRQGLTIGERCVIGMGQRVLQDCAAGTQLPPGRVA